MVAQRAGVLERVRRRGRDRRGERLYRSLDVSIGARMCRACRYQFPR